MEMKNKKLGIALLTFAVFTTTQGVYEPKTPWPLAPVKDAVVGTAGVITLGQTDADPSALPMTVPDAIPGVSYARTKDNCDSNCEKPNKKQRVKKEKTKKEKSCKKSCDSTMKKTRTKKAKCSDTECAAE